MTETPLTARRYRKTENVFRAGSAAEYIYFVRSGTLKSYNVTKEGEEEILSFFSAGQMAGVEALFGETHRTHCEALGACQVCRISLPAFRRQLQLATGLQGKVMGSLGDEVQRLHGLVHLQHCTAMQKVANFLLQEIRDHSRGAGSKPKEITLGMSRADIAQYLVLASETVSRVMTRLSKQRILRLRGRRIEILNYSALQQAAIQAA